MKYEDFDFESAREEYIEQHTIGVPMDFTPVSLKFYVNTISILNEILSEIKTIPEYGHDIVSSLCCIIGAFIANCSEEEPKSLYDKVCKRIRFYETLNREG